MSTMQEASKRGDAVFIAQGLCHAINIEADGSAADYDCEIKEGLMIWDELLNNIYWFLFFTLFAGVGSWLLRYAPLDF